MTDFEDVLVIFWVDGSFENRSTQTSMFFLFPMLKVAVGKI